MSRNHFLSRINDTRPMLIENFSGIAGMDADAYLHSGFLLPLFLHFNGRHHRIGGAVKDAQTAIAIVLQRFSIIAGNGISRSTK
ncbi:MAG: hypothetical protein ICV79_15125 [Flavisolibacter sp.]|nr:hypothetical protein [Flavisolibacter sp.]